MPPNLDSPPTSIKNKMTQDLNHKAVDKIPFSRWATGCIGAGGGIVLIFFFGQNAWASMLENEPRAAIV